MRATLIVDLDCASEVLDMLCALNLTPSVEVQPNTTQVPNPDLAGAMKEAGRKEPVEPHFMSLDCMKGYNPKLQRGKSRLDVCYALWRNPTAPNLVIAAECGVGSNLVSTIRNELENRGIIPLTTPAQKKRKVVK